MIIGVAVVWFSIAQEGCAHLNENISGSVHENQNHIKNAVFRHTITTIRGYLTSPSNNNMVDVIGSQCMITYVMLPWGPLMSFA